MLFGRPEKGRTKTKGGDDGRKESRDGRQSTIQRKVDDTSRVNLFQK